MPNLVEIDQTVADIWRFFDFSKMAEGRPILVCCVHDLTIHEGRLVVFITVQNLVGIDVVVAIICVTLA